MTIGERIKKRRLELGLTLEQVGKRLGVSKSAVAKWESGEIQNLRRSRFDELAKVLCTTPAELLGYQSAIDAHNRVNIYDNNGVLHEYSLTEKQVVALLAFLDNMK